MIDKRDADLMYLLGACGSALHAELKEKSHASFIPRYTPSADHRWDHPPMSTKCVVLGHDLACVPDLMLGHLVDGVDTDDVWARLSGVIASAPGETRETAAQIFPTLPLDHLKPINVMARVLALLATKGGTLRSPARCLNLEQDGKSYGVSIVSVTGPGIGLRVRRAHELDVWTALNVVGKPLEASLKFRDIEAHTVRYAPLLARGVRILIGAAVHSGPDFVEQFLDCFEFPDGPSDDDLSDPWTRARALVMGSSVSPIMELYDVLLPVLSANVFVKHFGNPHVLPGRSYSPRMRQKHGDAIDRLEGTASLQRRDKAFNQGEHAAAQALLKLQQQIGL